MNYMTPFERHLSEQEQIKQDSVYKNITNKVIPRIIPWANEVMNKASNEKRAQRESPLKEWWLNEQKKKKDNK